MIRKRELSMFKLHSKTFFNNDVNLGHAIIIMNRNNHASKFEVIFNVDEHDELHFYYENNICLDADEKVDFENWFIFEYKKCY